MSKAKNIRIAIALFVFGCVGCAGWNKTACVVIDTLEASCSVVRFVGEDGGVSEVQVPTSELAGVAAEKAGMRAAGTRGGCK